MNIQNKIIMHDRLAEIRDKHKSIALCSGCYDILQSGHAVFFSNARNMLTLLWSAPE